MYCSDQHALDLLSGPQAPNVVLRRMLTLPPSLSRAQTTENVGLGKYAEDQQLSRAIWAPATSTNVEDLQEENCRVLLGELSVPPSCTPSFNFGALVLEVRFSVYYLCYELMATLPPSAFSACTSLLERTLLLLFMNSISSTCTYPLRLVSNPSTRMSWRASW